MKAVALLRDQIYDYFQASPACQRHFHDAVHEDEYVQYYNSMYLLQDSTESLLSHREHGFSLNAYLAYLEFWGLMQALIIQQDAIQELHKVISGKQLDTKGLESWSEVRRLRNICAGHPAKKDRPKPVVRSFMGRNFGGYDAMTYELWKKGAGTTHPKVALGALIDAYAGEAGAQLAAVLAKMKNRWP